jgi:hypothetical protein
MSGRAGAQRLAVGILVREALDEELEVLAELGERVDLVPELHLGHAQARVLADGRLFGLDGGDRAAHRGRQLLDGQQVALFIEELGRIQERDVRELPEDALAIELDLLELLGEGRIERRADLAVLHEPAGRHTGALVRPAGLARGIALVAVGIRDHERDELLATLRHDGGAGGH